MQKVHIISIMLTLMIICLSAGIAAAQDAAKTKKDTVKRKVSMKDSLDGAFDVSDYMIYSNGFILVPIPITEPALGGIGGALIPIFLKKRQPVTDTVNGKVRMRRVNPDVTGGIALYTANNSWMAGVFRSGTFAKPGITYKAAAMYGSLNLTFYSTIPGIGEQPFNFNFKIAPVFLQAQKQFRNPHWSAGLQYMFLSTQVTPVGESLPDFVTSKEVSSIVSQLGGVIQYDSRDNIFTPDKGMHAQANFFWSGSAIGSDYESWRINYSFLGFTPITPKFFGGFRFDGQQALGSPPFYLLPYINLRGVPAARYQGNATLVSEVETRWDLYKRWSLMLFGGTGAAFNNWDNMFEHPLVYSYGTGFRYLIARKFKLRMGVDVARGPEQWAYYVVFGSNWIR